MEQTIYGSNRYLGHKKKRVERKLISKSHYRDRTCNNMVQNNEL